MSANTESELDARAARASGAPAMIEATICRARGCGCLIVPSGDVWCGHLNSGERVVLVEMSADVLQTLKDLERVRGERDQNAEIAEALAERVRVELDDYPAYSNAMDELTSGEKAQ